MPLYDYRCDHCGHSFTALQAMTDDPLPHCPKCGQQPRRVPSSPAIVFKGSGWHVTDYRPKQSDSSKDGAPSADEAATKADEAAKKKESASSKSEEKD